MWRKVWFGVLGVLAMAAAIPCGARAEDNTQNVSGWTFDAGLYGWTLWLEGQANVRGETFDLYADPIDLIDALDGPIIMANFEATKGRFSFFADVVYAEFGLDEDFASEASPIPQLQLEGNAQSASDLKFGVYQADAFYQVADFAGPSGGNTSVELGAGARFVQMDLTIKAQIDAGLRLRLGKLTDRLERRIKLIDDREQRLKSLAALNELRAELLDERIIRAGDKGHDKAIARLERRLKKVDARGDAIAALRALEKLELELLQAALNLDNKEFNGEFAFIGTDNMDWVDPVIALRLVHDLGNGRSITAMGDFGGFNINEGLSWQAVLTFDCEGTLFGYQTTTSVGYKALWLEFEEDTSKGTQGVDVVLHGPIAELAFRW